MIIAIDGPAGSGKSTIAREVARRFGFAKLDTGAMYRSVALAALRRGVDLDDADAVAALARGLSITFGSVSYTHLDVYKRQTPTWALHAAGGWAWSFAMARSFARSPKPMPTPLPHATPTSASLASPGPFTTQPMTATEMGLSQVLSRSDTRSAKPMRSTCVRPQVGQLSLIHI